MIALGPNGTDIARQGTLSRNDSSAGAPVRLRVVGDCAILVGERRVEPLSELVFGMLLYLATERGKRIARETLLALFWPGVEEGSARHCLRQTVYKIRRLGVTVDCSGSIVSVPSAQVASDGVSDLSAESCANASLASGTTTANEFLPGYAPRFSEEFTAWIDEQRTVAEGAVRRALLDAIVTHRAAHRWADVETLARDCLRFDSLNEEATLALAESFALTGQKARAVAVLDDYLEEMGPGGPDLHLQASLLRKRVTERLPMRSPGAADRCFVGRDDSMAWLSAHLREARAGRGAACVVWGAPGIGKSRLVSEFSDLAVLEGLRFQKARCQEGDLRRPLSLFMDCVPGLQKLPGAAGCDPESVRFLRRLTEHDGSATSVSEESRESEYLYSRIRRAIFDLFEAVSEEKCLVFVVEDVHWLDELSWEVLREMARWCRTRSVLLVFTSREADSGSKADTGKVLEAQRRQLTGIDQGSSLTLVNALLSNSDRVADASFRSWCVQVGEGSPLFLRELVSHWVATGHAYSVPSTIDALIGARLARLKPRALRVLQGCAVLGTLGSVARLEAMLQYKRHALIDSLEELEREELITMGLGEVQSRHDLISRAALARLRSASQTVLRRGAASVLEAELGETQSTVVLWACAGHWSAVGEPARALRVLRDCARHLMEIGLPSEGAKVYEGSLAYCTTDRERLELLDQSANALSVSGQWDAVLEVLERRDACCRASSHGGVDYGDHEFLRWRALWRRGSSVRGLFELAAQGALSSYAPSSFRLTAAVWAMIFAENMGSSDEALPVLTAVRPLTTNPDAAPIAVAKLGMMRCVAEERYVEARSYASAVVQLEREGGAPHDLTTALINFATLDRRTGDLDSAVSATQEAFVLAETYNLEATAVHCAAVLALMEIDQAHFPSAQSWIERGARRYNACDDFVARANLDTARARLALLTGDYESAAAVIDTNLEQIKLKSSPRFRAFQISAYSELALAGHATPLDESSVNHFRDAFIVTRGCQGNDFIAFALHRALLAIGHISSAHSLLSTYKKERTDIGAPLAYYIGA